MTPPRGPVTAHISVPDTTAPSPSEQDGDRSSRARFAPLANQTVIAGITVVAAVSSVLLPWLEVTNGPAMWSGVVLALLGLAATALIVCRPALLTVELLVPALDFVAIGLLRFGTGDARSVFLAAILLPLIWIAARPGRRHIVYPLAGTAVTFLLPIVLDPGDILASELVRLVFVLLVFAAVAGVTNELARQAALRLRTAQQLRRIAESEIGQAARVQRALLPGSDVGIPAEFTVRGVCLPARSVGGDFYDWFPTADGAAFTLGDVMGKGAGAGMIAAVVRSVMRTSVDAADPAESMAAASGALSTDTGDASTDQFTTCFHLRVAADGTARWADAGHGLNLLLRRAGGSEWLRSGDLPIGVDTAWTSTRTALLPGDVVVSVSDGVLDLFGGDVDALEAFRAFATAHPEPDDLVTGIGALGDDVEHDDDVTVLAVRYDGR